jgi:hypothetical protein
MTTLLWTFRDRLVTDPRDKIYSLLGIFERDSNFEGTSAGGKSVGFDRQKLIIDYHMPVEEIYASLVDAVVSNTKSLNIVCASQYPGPFTRSWVPDWTEPWQRYSFLTSRTLEAYQVIQDNRGPELYRASASRPALFSFSNGRASLSVEGIQWDRILSLYESQCVK